MGTVESGRLNEVNVRCLSEKFIRKVSRRWGSLSSYRNIPLKFSILRDLSGVFPILKITSISLSSNTFVQKYANLVPDTWLKAKHGCTYKMPSTRVEVNIKSIQFKKKYRYFLCLKILASFHKLALAFTMVQVF